MNLKGSRTEKNLKKAIHGEALACVKYQIYASLIGSTSKDWEDQIDHIAHNEKEHFKVWAKLLLGDKYYDNQENLFDALSGEIDECTKMYPEFAKIAKEEGFNEIADKFEKISKIECAHSQLFEGFLQDLSDDKHRKSQEKNDKFICLNCGYIHQGNDIPAECPVCNHPKQYFKKVD